MAESTFHAPDIQCDGCANSIKRAIGRLPGVAAVEVDVEAKSVRVQHDEGGADRAAVAAALEKAGFPTA